MKIKHLIFIPLPVLTLILYRKTDTTKLLVEQTVSQLRTTSAALVVLKLEIQSLESSLPEYPVVMRIFDAGPALGPKLMAEMAMSAVSTPRRHRWLLLALKHHLINLARWIFTAAVSLNVVRLCYTERFSC